FQIFSFLVLTLFTVFVPLVPPSIADEPTELVVTRLSPVVITCTASGVPEPTIHWSKDGMKLPKTGPGYSILSNRSTVFPGAPSIIVEPVETVVDAGTTSVLNCQAEGEPSPMIEWSWQGRPLLGNDRFSTLSNGSLRISSAQKEDTAEYECVARNLLGSVLVRVTLTVRGELDTVHFVTFKIFISKKRENKYIPGSGCATTPLQHLMGRSVRAQTHKHKCARRGHVLVRALLCFEKHFPFHQVDVRVMAKSRF
uniref:Ig-like domain-containing protein n=1 Tax=Amphiprion percula TaxID=161767 RepID=A0A3P8RVT3_AMPPE